MSCLLLAPGRSRARLKAVLRDRGIHIVDPREAMVGTRNTAVLRELIREADFVVAYVERESSTVAYQVGFAAALRTPIMLVVPSAKQGLSRFLTSHPYVVAAANDRAAIGFYLDQFLESGLKAERSHRPSSPPDDVADGGTIGEVRATLRRSEDLHQSDLMGLLDSALDAAGLTHMSDRFVIGDTLMRPDMALWVKRLESVTGNPLLVELKMESSGASGWREASNQLRGYVREAGAEWGLLLSQRGPVSEDLGPHVLAMTIDEFLVALQSNTLADRVTQLVAGLPPGGP
jgi:hypothetical protein